MLDYCVYYPVCDIHTNKLLQHHITENKWVIQIEYGRLIEGMNRYMYIHIDWLMEQQRNGAFYVMNLHFSSARYIQCSVEEVIISNITIHTYVDKYKIVLSIRRIYTYVHVCGPTYHRVVENIKLKWHNISCIASNVVLLNLLEWFVDLFFSL